jgi:hypothetical protein
VRIRVQTNGLPARCAAMPTTVTWREVSIDWEADFNPAVAVSTVTHSPASQTAVDALLCSVNTVTATVPAASNFVDSSSVPYVRARAPHASPVLCFALLWAALFVCLVVGSGRGAVHSFKSLGCVVCCAVLCCAVVCGVAVVWYAQSEHSEWRGGGRCGDFECEQRR